MWHVLRSLKGGGECIFRMKGAKFARQSNINCKGGSAFQALSGV